jgi:heme/copper-type cytochrome/quinol oxidase subunit 2
MVVLMRRAMIGMERRLWVAIALFLIVGAVHALAAQDRRIVRVRAERFAFTPSEIRVTEGESIELRIRSDDTAHGFRLTGTDVDIVIPKRGKGEMTIDFVAPAAGRYEFECTRMCGAGHSFMRGVLVVTPAPVAGGQGAQ